MKKILAIILCALMGISAADAQTKRIKVLIDNDFCGDPDGLFQLAHQALMPSTDIVGIIGGHLSAGGGFTQRTDQSAESVEKAEELLAVLGMKGKIKVVQGAHEAMTSQDIPVDSEGARLIISEARKCSPEKPLYVCVGGALTNIASALLLDPSISDNIILVWIGGQEYSFGAVPPPGYTPVEYNLNLSIAAGQAVFNKSDVRIWQVPRDAYRQCLYSTAELHTKIQPYGEIGALLSGAIDSLMERMSRFMSLGDVYILGDSPLVLLTSLQSCYEPDPSSSRWIPTPCPLIDDNGAYQPNPTGRVIRVYTQIDTRLMFADLEARLAENSK